MLMIRLPGLIDTNPNVSGQSLAGKWNRPSNTINNQRYQVLIEQELWIYWILKR